jgi:GTP pyrophosphokinase
MHRHAELGVAAHWAYKERKGHDAELQRRVVWMRNWLELKNEGEDGGDFVERFKSELEPAHVYVLTPHAKVIELPKGATVLDFAYAIHSEVGNRCRGARVDGRIVPLNQTLRSGQSVEIITQKNASPSRDWLSPHHGYLRTAKARNRVRQWFKQQDYDRYVSEGRSLVEKEMARLGIDGRPNLERIGLRFNLRRAEDLLAAVGRGEIPPGQVARRAGEPRADAQSEAADAEALDLAAKRRSRRRNRVPRREGVHPEVVVEGVDDLLTHMAQCCKPVPRDPIVGFVTRGRGVTVHRRDCRNLRRLPEEERARLLEVRWAEALADSTFPVDLLVLAADRKGLLRDIGSVLSDEDVDVVGVNTVSDRLTDRAAMRFTVEVRDMDQLALVLGKLRQIPDVLDVRRPR